MACIYLLQYKEYKHSKTVADEVLEKCYFKNTTFTKFNKSLHIYPVLVIFVTVFLSILGD